MNNWAQMISEEMRDTREQMNHHTGWLDTPSFDRFELTNYADNHGVYCGTLKMKSLDVRQKERNHV